MNDNCVIGILCIDIKFKIREKFGEQWQSYIKLNYVKYLENCNVVPIRIGRPKEYYYDILNKLNGVLMPGGAVWFNDPVNGKCVESAKFIFHYAKELYLKGIYFPIWGTCLGYQMLLFADACENSEPTKSLNIRIKCEPFKGDLPIKFQNDFRESKLFCNIPNALATIMESESISFYNHQFCVTRDTMRDCNILDNWKILSTRQIPDLEFITSIEHKIYPFYGVQFHPENHGPENKTSNANQILCAKYFASFFINEAKRNSNINRDECLIDNFKLIATGSISGDCYVFEGNDVG